MLVEIPDIIESKDYKSIKTHKGNRSPSEENLDRLKNELLHNNKFQFHPIIVDKNNYIIDGQHRFFAAMHLNLPFYYVRDKNADIQDIISINTSRVNWKLNDYINFYHQRGNEEYTFIERLSQKCRFYNKSFTVVYQILSTIKYTRNLAENLRTGKYKLKLEEKERVFDFVEKSLGRCKDINVKIYNKNKTMTQVLLFKRLYISFLLTCFKNMKKDEYERLWDILDANFHLLKDFNSMQEIKDHISNLYNSGIPKNGPNKKCPFMQINFNFEELKQKK